MTAPADDITPEEIAEMERRCEAATPGPWRTLRKRMVFSSSNLDFATIVLKPGEDEWSPGPDRDTRDNGHETEGVNHDAPFIAHARTDLPRLLAALRRRDAEIHKLKMCLFAEVTNTALEISNGMMRAAAIEKERDAAKALLARAVEQLRAHRRHGGADSECAATDALLAEIEAEQ